VVLITLAGGLRTGSRGLRRNVPVGKSGHEAGMWAAGGESGRSGPGRFRLSGRGGAVRFCFFSSLESSGLSVAPALGDCGGGKTKLGEKTWLLGPTNSLSCSLLIPPD